MNKQERIQAFDKWIKQELIKLPTKNKVVIFHMDFARGNSKTGELLIDKTKNR